MSKEELKALPQIPSPDIKFLPKRAGYEAAMEGEPKYSCPHKANGRARIDWMTGWYMGNEGKVWGQSGSCGDSDLKQKLADPKAPMRAQTRAMFEGMRRAA
jgi:ribosome modulation factor